MRREPGPHIPIEFNPRDRGADAARLQLDRRRDFKLLESELKIVPTAVMGSEDEILTRFGIAARSGMNLAANSRSSSSEADASGLS